MATTNRTTRPALGPDPSTIRNPYARPKATSLDRARPLPEVVRMPDMDARFALQRGDDPPGLDVIGGSIWLLVYRCLYPHGVRDEIARFSRVVARSEAEAVRAMQGRMYGFAERIELYDVWHFEPVDTEKETADGRG